MTLQAACAATGQGPKRECRRKDLELFSPELKRQIANNLNFIKKAAEKGSFSKKCIGMVYSFQGWRIGQDSHT